MIITPTTLISFMMDTVHIRHVYLLSCTFVACLVQQLCAKQDHVSLFHHAWEVELKTFLHYVVLVVQKKNSSHDVILLPVGTSISKLLGKDYCFCERECCPLCCYINIWLNVVDSPKLPIIRFVWEFKHRQH